MITLLNIVSSYKSKGIISIFSPKRSGKTDALNSAVTESKNEIIIFSDANSMFQHDAVRKLVRHFKNVKIGGVCGRKSILHSEKRKSSIGR